MNDTGKLMRKYEKSAASVADFLDRYYKASRYGGYGADYATYLLASYERDFAQHGWVMISHHDSNTGEICSYYGRTP